MIAYLEGKVIYKNTNSCILLCGKVGYEIFLSNNINVNLNEEKKLYIYNHIREDSNILYGFEDIRTRELYIQFLKVKGIGPKVALSIVSYKKINEIYNALEEGNLLFFTEIPGIGKKAASHIILDLKGFLSKNINSENKELKEVKEVLLKLGYHNKEIKEVFSKIKIQDKQKDVIIKECLFILSGRK